MRKQDSVACLFPLFIFLLSVLPTHIQARNMQQCSSSCGDVKDISYPFRLEGDPIGCGDPDFQLSCENNKSVMNYQRGKYYVKGISYVEHTIRLVDVNLADGICALPYKSLSMDEATNDFRYPSLITFWQANFVNCSNNILQLSDHKVPCLSGTQFQVYVNFSDRQLFDFDIPQTCKVVSVIPTSASSADVVNSSYETTMKLLASGFDLRWSVENIYEYDYYEIILWDAISILASGSLIIDAEFVVRFIFLPLVVFAFLLHKYLTTRKEMVDAEIVPDNPQIEMVDAEIVPDNPQIPQIEMVDAEIVPDNLQIPQSDCPKQVLMPKRMQRSS